MVTLEKGFRESWSREQPPPPPPESFPCTAALEAMDREGLLVPTPKYSPYECEFRGLGRSSMAKVVAKAETWQDISH